MRRFPYIIRSIICDSVRLIIKYKVLHRMGWRMIKPKQLQLLTLESGHYGFYNNLAHSQPLLINSIYFTVLWQKL